MIFELNTLHLGQPSSSIVLNCFYLIIYELNCLISQSTNYCFVFSIELYVNEPLIFWHLYFIA